MIWSGFAHAHVILGGESYVAQTGGPQNALWALVGTPTKHRSECLAAAFRNLDPDKRPDLITPDDTLCEHLGNQHD
jgi:hypothetical protein